MCSRFRKSSALFLLTLLLVAYTGQTIHIFLEDRAHFAAFSGDLVPDNRAHESVVELCIIDDFPFYPYLELSPFICHFCLTLLEVLSFETTHCRHILLGGYVSLRAPPSGSGECRVR